MKVLELLSEIEEIVDTSSAIPFSGKIMVDSDELLEIVKEIRMALPEEVQQAKWIIDERERIINDAKKEYEALIKDAQEQATSLVENNEITAKAKVRAEEILRTANSSAKQLKMSTYDYVDRILFNFQAKVDELNAEYFGRMFDDLSQTFDAINSTLTENRDEIKDMAVRTQNDME